MNKEKFPEYREKVFQYVQKKIIPKYPEISTKTSTLPIDNASKKTREKILNVISLLVVIVGAPKAK